MVVSVNYKFMDIADFEDSVTLWLIRYTEVNYRNHQKWQGFSGKIISGTSKK